MTIAAPRILAFDTSSQITSLAICIGERVLVEHHSETEPGSRHAEVLLPRIQRALAEAALPLADIDVIAVGVGPGSFTGVRVGVATAKGLGFALRKPVVPVVSLDALAHEAARSCQQPWVAACLDAFKGELFAAVYALEAGAASRALAPFHAVPEVVRDELAAVSGEQALLLVGGGVARYPALLTGAPRGWLASEAIAAPRASSVAQLARARVASGDIPQLESVAPLYLRASDAQLPKVPLRT